MKGMVNMQGELEFEKLYKAHYEKLYRAAFRLTGNQEDAQDVIQDTFLNAFKAFKSFRNESTFGTWIYKIMLNCSYKFIKKRDHLPIKDIAKREGMSEQAFWESIQSRDLVEDEAMVEDMRETCLQLFLNCLPKQQKIAFTLQVLLAFPVKEVAQIMNISESAVKVNVFRARQHLKDNMEEKCSFIKPDNPCNCSNWVKYAIKKGTIKYIPKANPVHKRKNHDLSIIINEMSTIAKIKLLYDNHPQHKNYSDFIQQMKAIISSGQYKILS